MTTTQAKKLCRAKFGRLPRCGYESIAHEETFKCRFNHDHKRTYWLVNISGVFQVRVAEEDCLSEFFQGVQK